MLQFHAERSGGGNPVTLQSNEETPRPVARGAVDSGDCTEVRSPASIRCLVLWTHCACRRIAHATRFAIKTAGELRGARYRCHGRAICVDSDGEVITFATHKAGLNFECASHRRCPDRCVTAINAQLKRLCYRFNSIAGEM